MIINNIQKKSSESAGFTIVELLVVIVVIGILAAITIVSYTGITSRANSVASQSAAAAFTAKAEVYYADGPNSRYPGNFNELATATSDKSYFLTGVTFDGTLLASGHLPATSNTINVYRCGIQDGADTAAPTVLTSGVTNGIDTITGVYVKYWDYTALSTITVSAGNTATAVGGHSVGCIITPANNSAI